MKVYVQPEKIAVNRYKLLQFLGEGSSGSIYKALDLITHEIIAIKFFKSKPDENHKFEFKTLAGFNHKNLVKVFDFGYDFPDSFFTMEFVGEKNIRNFFEKTDFVGVCEMALQVLSGLDYIHSKKILHGDLKPENILIDEKEKNLVFKLIDFGLSSIVLLENTALIGTVDYIAPEKIKSNSVTTKSDLYSFGVILYEIFSGELPFNFPDSPNSVFEGHLYKMPKPLSELNPEIPENIENFVKKLLEKNPNNRFLSVSEAFRELSKIIPKKLKTEIFISNEQLFTSDFLVGRAKELEVLQNLTSSFKLERKPEIAFITGKMGCGKSHFVKEIRIFSQISGFNFLIASRKRTKKTFFYVKDVLANLKIIFSSSKIIRQNQKLISQFLDEDFIENRKEDFDFALAKDIFFSKLAKLFLAVLKENNLVICFEDFSFVDKLSQEFLFFLARSYLKTNLTKGFLIYTSRNETQTLLTKFLFEDKNVTKFLFEEFNQNDFRNFIEGISGQKIEDANFISLLFRESEGNPFFAIEILKFLTKEKMILRKNDKWIFPKKQEIVKILPEDIKEILLKSLEIYPLESQNILRIASVLNEFEIEIIEKLLCKKHLAPKINELLENKILFGEKQDDKIRYKFCHSELEQAIYQNLSESERQKIHLGYAEFLESLNDENYTKEIGEHFYLSSEPEKSFPFLVKAGKQAELIFAFHDACELFKKALKILDNFLGNFTLSHTIDVLEKLSTLNFKLGDIKNEEIYLNRLEVVIKSSGDSGKITNILLRKCDFLVRTNGLPEAEEKAKLCFEKAKGLKSFTLEAEVYNLLGRIKHEQENYKEAIVYHQKALSLITFKEKPNFYIGILNNLGNCYKNLNNYKEALSSFNKVLDFANQSSNRQLLGKVLNNISQLYFGQGNFEEAINFAQKSMQIFRELDDKRNLPKSLNQLANAYVNIRQTQKAIEFYLESLEISRITGDKQNETLSLNNLGFSYAQNQDFVQAYKYFYECVRLLKSEEKQNLSKELGNLGLVCFALGKIEEAETFLQEALLNSEKTDYKKGKGVILDNLANLNFQLGKIQKAKSYAVESIKLTREFGYKFILAEHLLCYGKILVEEGELANAKNVFQESLEIADNLNLNTLKVLANSYLAIIFLNSNHLKEAMEFSSKALEIFENEGEIYFGEEEFLFNHYLVLRESENVKAYDFLKRAYQKIISLADKIPDANNKKVFLETYHTNQKIWKTLIFEDEEKIIQNSVNNKTLSTLYKINQSLAEDLLDEKLLEKILALAMQNTQAENGVLILKEGQKFQVKVVSENADEEVTKDVAEISQSIIEDVTSIGKMIFVRDALQDESFNTRQSIKIQKIHSILCFPLRKGGEILGTLYVDRRKNKVPFSEADVNFLQAFANLSGTTIANFRKFTEVKTENARLKIENEKFKFEENFYDGFIGRSEKMQNVFRLLKGAIKSEANVLIFGESGTGKEIIARIIHEKGKRNQKPFIAIDCGALPESLFESELFGYKKGAFTGAFADKKGLFEEANGGTIFLDEITNTNLTFQSRLLRVIQEGEIRKIGESEVQKVDVRIIAATNLDIKKEIDEKRFREDLFFRLNVIPINLPALRERKEDIPLLTRHFVEKFAKKTNIEINTIEPKLISYFQNLPWKGNIRELENLIYRMIVFAENSILSLGELPQEYLEIVKEPQISFRNKLEQSFPTFDEMASEYIKLVLTHCKNNQTKAAEILDLKRETLRSKMKKLEVK
ncbi:sigma 54-interacting transcriptional regulator [bacterium]|nr:sigma 54-interacting transcriptional regulator [bacterium]